MKVIILGPPLTGKSTLARYLRTNHKNLTVKDFDEEIFQRNNGEWPEHGSELMIKLKADVIKDILNLNEVVFVAFEMPASDLIRAKKLRFKTFLLLTDIKELARRNVERLKTDPHNDAFQFVEYNIQQHLALKEEGLIDVQLDARRPVNEIADEIFKNI